METRAEVLRRINWEYTYTVEDFERLLASEDLSDKKFIYVKLLQGVRWYTLLSILSKKELKEAMSLEVVRAVFPQPLRDTYMYVRKSLYP
jgi:hypothetical protein